MATAFRFNKSNLLALVKQGETTTVRDTEEKGLRFKVGKQRSVFLFEKRISGRKKTPPVTITIGAFPAITLEEARQQARVLASLCEKGIDPRQGPEQETRPIVTLRMAVDKFLEVKKQQIGAKCWGKYESVIRHHLPRCWYPLDINTITEDMLLEQFHVIRQNHRFQCWGFFKVYSNMWNTTKPYFRDGKNQRILGANPIPEARKLLGKLKRDPPKRPVIPATLLGKFVVTVEGLRSGKLSTTSSRSGRPPAPSVRRICDIVLLSLFTAFRLTEMRCLRWEYVNLEHGIIFLPGKDDVGAFKGTKNSHDHWLPLSSYAWDLLKWIERERDSTSPYVFPSVYDPEKPISRNRAVCEHISRLVGSRFSPHMCRRTFASVADEAGLGFLKVKRLLNHAFQGGVTGGYVVPGFNPAKERESMQLVCDYILEQRAAHLGDAKAEKGIDKQAAIAKLRRYARELGLDPDEVLIDSERSAAA